MTKFTISESKTILQMLGNHIGKSSRWKLAELLFWFRSSLSRAIQDLQMTIWLSTSFQLFHCVSAFGNTTWLWMQDFFRGTFHYHSFSSLLIICYLFQSRTALGRKVCGALHREHALLLGSPILDGKDQVPGDVHSVHSHSHAGRRLGHARGESRSRQHCLWNCTQVPFAIQVCQTWNDIRVHSSYCLISRQCKAIWHFILDVLYIYAKIFTCKMILHWHNVREWMNS